MGIVLILLIFICGIFSQDSELAFIVTTEEGILAVDTIGERLIEIASDGGAGTTGNWLGPAVDVGRRNVMWRINTGGIYWSDRLAEGGGQYTRISENYYSSLTPSLGNFMYSLYGGDVYNPVDEKYYWFSSTGTLWSIDIYGEEDTIGFQMELNLFDGPYDYARRCLGVDSQGDLYYSQSSEYSGRGIYKLSSFNITQQILAQADIVSIEISVDENGDEKIFYAIGRNLFKINLDGTEPEKVNFFKSSQDIRDFALDIPNNRVFYRYQYNYEIHTFSTIVEPVFVDTYTYYDYYHLGGISYLPGLEPGDLSRIDFTCRSGGYIDHTAGDIYYFQASSSGSTYTYESGSIITTLMKSSVEDITKMEEISISFLQNSLIIAASFNRQNSIIYLIESDQNGLYSIDPYTNDITLLYLDTTGNLFTGNGFTVDDYDNKLYFVDAYRSLYSYDLNGPAGGTLPISIGSFDIAPIALRMSCNGNIFLMDYSAIHYYNIETSQRVTLYESDGKIINTFTTSEVDGKMVLYWVEDYNHIKRKEVPNGITQTIFSTENNYMLDIAVNDDATFLAVSIYVDVIFISLDQTRDPLHITGKDINDILNNNFEFIFQQVELSAGSGNPWNSPGVSSAENIIFTVLLLALALI